MIAAASLSSAKIVPHLLNSMFVAEDDAAPLVAAGDDLVEETGPVDVEGHVAELVEDDQVGTGEVCVLSSWGLRFVQCFSAV